MANERRPPQPRATSVQELESAARPSGLESRRRLDELLIEHTVFRHAQGVLAQRSGGTLTRAGHVLLHLGAQVGLPSGEAAGQFFLACVAETDNDLQTRRMLDRVIASAGPPSRRHRDYAESVPMPVRRFSPPGSPVDRGVAVELPAGLGVGVHGDLDIAASPLLAEAIRAHLTAAGRQPTVVLDLHRLRFCDVAGVRALKAASLQVRDTGAQLHVVSPTARTPRWLLSFAVSQGWLPGEFAGAAPPNPSWTRPASATAEPDRRAASGTPE